MMKHEFVSVLGLAFVVITGCSTSDQGGTNVSTVQGKLELASFPTAPETVEAIDESGAITEAAADSDGGFSLALEEGHSYRIDVKSGSEATPVVFARGDGRLAKSFRVSSGDATMDLGAVRHLDSAPSAGFTAWNDPNGLDEETCEDGIDVATGAACVDDESQEMCEHGTRHAADDDDVEGGEADEHSSAEFAAGGSGPMGAMESDAAGGVAQAIDSSEVDENSTDTAGDDSPMGLDDADTCIAGLDSATGAPCTGDDDVDAALPMAVPEHNVPEEFGHCS